MSDKTIFAGNSAQAVAGFETLAREGGGTLALKPSDAPYVMRLIDRGKAEDAPVRITSADPERPAVVAELLLNGRENVDVDSLVFDSTGISRDQHHWDLELRGATGITVSDVEFRGGGDRSLRTRGEDAEASALAVVRWSEDVVIEDSVGTGYYHGISVLEADDVTLRGLDLSRLQGDAIRLGGVQDVLIEDNYLHDMLGTLQSVNHSDMIQIWGTNIKQNNERITIRDNVISTGDGPNYQLIFGNNPHLKRNGYLFEDIVVEGNVLHGAHRSAIRVFDTKDMVVRDNTVLWNAETMGLDGDSNRGASRGWIELPNSRGAVIEGNIASHIAKPTGKNTIINYTDPANPNYFARHFVNLEAQGSADLRDLSLLPDSPLNGRFGAPIGWTPDGGSGPGLQSGPGAKGGVTAVAEVERSVTDISVLTLDAGLSQAGEALLGGRGRYAWVFEDGTKRWGETVTHDFETPGEHSYQLQARLPGGGQDVIERTVVIADPLLLDLDMRGRGVSDASSYDSPVQMTGRRPSSEGFVLDGRSAVEVSRDAGQLHALEQFELGLSFAPAKDGGAGQLFTIRGTINGYLHRDGSLEIRLQTNEGEATVRTDPGALRPGTDGEIVVRYDGAALSVWVDGEPEGQAALTGLTAPAAHHGLVFGRQFKPSAEGVLSDVTMSAEVGDAGGVLGARGSAGGSDGGSDGGGGGGRPDRPEPWSPEDAVVALDFEGTLEDLAGDARLSSRGDPEFVAGRGGGQAVSLGDGAAVTIARENGFLFERDAFAMAFDLNRNGEDEAGRILKLHRTMEANVWTDGSLAFALTTDEGRFVARSAPGAISGDDWHRVEIGYDDADDVLALRIDGEVVETTASGSTAERAYWGLTLGTHWGDGLQADLDRFVFDDAAGWL